MRLIVNFPKPFAALEDALAGTGCELLRRVWEPELAAKSAAEGCLLDFCDAARHLKMLWRLSRALRPAAIPLIAIDRDAPWYKGVRGRRLVAISLLRPLDIYASHSLQGAQRFADDTLYLPNAARIGDYNLRGRSLEALRARETYRYEVSFLGNVDQERYPEHAPRVAELRRLRDRLAADGIKLEMFESSGMPVDEQVRIIQQSRINLNLGAAADDRGERSWGLPERCYGIPACGGFLLSDQRKHASDDFHPRSEWVEYDGLEDCAAMIRYYLAHFDQARAIAEAAHRRVVAEHTYLHRARRLMQVVADWRSAHRKET